MRANELKEILTLDQIILLMEHFGADYLPYVAGSKEIQFRTVCHCGNSHKLYLYTDSKEFHCYSECGQMDIITIAEKMLNVKITEAIEYICNFVGIETNHMRVGFHDDNLGYNSEDWEIFNMMKPTQRRVDSSREFNKIDVMILNRFYDMYHPSFYNDGIATSTLKKFGIKYDILEQRVIIPHYDECGHLIAIRCRNLKQSLLEEGRKYTPIVLDRKLLSAPTAKYLYGLNFNIENIKRAKKVILVESEKAVMQLESILEHNIAVALMSSSLSHIQVQILKDLGVQEIIIALDKEYVEYGSREEKLYAMKIRKGIINKLGSYFGVSVLWDIKNLIGYKQSPTDAGADVFWELMNNRIRIN